jgi:hypothetical protein
MPFSNIDSPKKYFEATTYTGNGSTQSITSLDFSPDFVWLKKRNDVGSHNLFDSIRGATKWLLSNSTDAEGTTATSLTSFDANGFSLGSNASTNSNTNTFISWSWRGSDSSAVSNTNGSITSTVSASTVSGFSIVKWTGSGANATVGHGLGVAPKMIIIKNYGDAVNLEHWRVGHSSISSTFSSGLLLSSADASWTSSGVFNNTAPTSSVFTVGTFNSANGSADNMIAYCFAEVKGYSKFSSYTGNGSTDGTFVYTGFSPAFVMVKSTSAAGTWCMLDNKRSSFNEANKIINAEDSAAEFTATGVDFTSNGFKHRNSNTNRNASGVTFIYMAFAQNPFVSSKGIPTTAR